MKNKLLLGALVLGCIVPVTLAAGEKKAAVADAGTTYRMAGGIVKSELSNNDDVIVAEGNEFNITLDEVNIRSRLTEIDGRKGDKKEIVDDLILEKAFYQEAVDNDCKVDEKSVNDEIAELKDLLNTAENADMIKEYIKGFGSEQDYWEYVKERVQVKGTNAAYLQKIAGEYCEKNNEPVESVEESSGWKKYKENMEQSMIDAQDVEVNYNKIK